MQFNNKTTVATSASLTEEKKSALLSTLKTRFHKYPERHQGIAWIDVEKKLASFPEKLQSLAAMEETGGEPDVTGYDPDRNTHYFTDCAPESPADRRSICYDRDARTSRKKFPPEHSAEEMARRIGIEILSEKQYRALQALGPFDTKTSSWLKTPEDVRKRGGAIFGDRRFGRVFVYHNGADSYYASRGFRGVLEI